MKGRCRHFVLFPRAFNNLSEKYRTAILFISVSLFFVWKAQREILRVICWFTPQIPAQMELGKANAGSWELPWGWGLPHSARDPTIGTISPAASQGERRSLSWETLVQVPAGYSNVSCRFSRGILNAVPSACLGQLLFLWLWQDPKLEFTRI